MTTTMTSRPTEATAANDSSTASFQDWNTTDGIPDGPGDTGSSYTSINIITIVYIVLGILLLIGIIQFTWYVVRTNTNCFYNHDLVN